MNEKLSFQNLSDSLAQKAGISKKVADTFAKAFFDTIVDALYMGEESIKVKGLGTFKLVEVESRESVNVSNGERIIIPGYKKVSFAPEDSVVEFLNRDAVVEEKMVEEKMVVETAEESVAETEEEPVVEAEQTPVAANEAVVVEETASSIDLAPSAIEMLMQVPEPTHVEQPQNEFAGIDLLISTPESVDDIRLQYEEAKARVDEAMEEVRKAHAEALRLEKLLERLESNVVPESVENRVEDIPQPIDAEVEQPVEDEVSAETAGAVEESQPAVSPQAQEEKRNETFERYINGSEEEKVLQEAEQAVAQKKNKRSFTWLWVMLLVMIPLAAIVYFMYRTSESIDSVKNVPMEEQPEMVERNTEEEVQKDAEKQNVPHDSIVGEVNVKAETQVVEEQKPQRPATYKMQKGESLTLISQRFYGTKDSVSAIIRVNTFADPNNVPIGAVIKLP